MTIQPFLQMIYGKPKLRVGFGERDSHDIAVLLGEIFNVPVHSGILYRLGARTIQADDVWGTFRIEEADTRKEVYEPPHLPEINTYAGIKAQRATVPASPVPAQFLRS